MMYVFHDHNAHQGFPMPLDLPAHKWVKERRLDLGLRQEDVESMTEKMGAKHIISQSHLSRIERGTKSLSSLGPDRMDALRRVLNVGHEEWVDRTGLEIVTTERLETLGAQQTLLPDHRFTVPVYALASAGMGVWTEEGILKRIEVESWVAERRGQVTFCVDGDSMEPTMRKGDYIHVDVLQKDIQEGKLYVVQVAGDGIIVKRAKMFRGEWVLVSDNPLYAPLRPQEATVIGRVFALTPQTIHL